MSRPARAPGAAMIASWPGGRYRRGRKAELWSSWPVEMCSWPRRAHQWSGAPCFLPISSRARRRASRVRRGQSTSSRVGRVAPRLVGGNVSACVLPLPCRPRRRARGHVRPSRTAPQPATRESIPIPSSRTMRDLSGQEGLSGVKRVLAAAHALGHGGAPEPARPRRSASSKTNGGWGRLAEISGDGQPAQATLRRACAAVVGAGRGRSRARGRPAPQGRLTGEPGAPWSHPLRAVTPSRPGH